MLHGEAVAVGLMFAAELAASLGRTGSDAVARHRDLLDALGLPVTAPAHLSAESLLTLMRRDKKATGGLTVVLDGPHGLEKVEDPDPDMVAKALSAIGVHR